MTRALSLVMLVALGGCATVPGAPDAATVTVPARFATPPPSPNAAVVRDLLPAADPAFQPLIADAFAAAPDLAAALARIDIARAGVRSARATRLPEVGGSASVARQRQSSNAFGSLPEGTPFQSNRTQFDAAISASWDADLFGRLRASERASRARLDAATADAAAVRLALVSDIAMALTDFRAAEARRKVIADDLAEVEALAELTGTRARAGIAPEFDLVRARSLVADARARLGPVASERAAALAALVTLTALPQDVIEARLGDAQLPPAGPVPAPGVPSEILRLRPDVAAAESRLAAADAEIASAAAERFPRLSITSSLGLIALAFGDLFESDAVIGSLGAGLAGPLLDFGRVGARIDQRQAEAAEAFAGYRGTVFAALADVERALGQLAAADARAAALAERVAIDRDSTGLAAERYRRGLTDFLTVIDAQRSLNIARETAIEAEAARLRRRVELYRAIGGDPAVQAIASNRG